MALTCGVLSKKHRPRADSSHLLVGRLNLEFARKVDGQNPLRCRVPVAHPARRHALEPICFRSFKRREHHWWRVLEVVVDLLEWDVDILEMRLTVVVGKKAKKFHSARIYISHTTP
jgi:hypothetical protein